MSVSGKTKSWEPLRLESLPQKADRNQAKAVSPENRVDRPSIEGLPCQEEDAVKKLLVSLFSFAILLVATPEPWAQNDQSVDWSQTAATLDILNAQILDWQTQFETLSKPPVTEDSLNQILILHFQKGPMVLAGLKALMDSWMNDASDSEKKSRYLAISQYFSAHTVALVNSYAWEWYRCFSPPLSARYNFLIADSGLPPVQVGPQDKNLLSSLSPDERKALFQRCRPTITAFLSRNNYPLFEVDISRMIFAFQGIFLDGRYPEDKTQLNADFTFAGNALFLFGMGI
jgi:hypothetical protein